jgi:hypothetical protein
MGGWLPWPQSWPTNPNQLAIPPAESLYPTSLEELDLLELAEAAALLRIACGRSQLPLKQPKRAILCVIASIIDYEIFHRTHH